jgi:hypothetical protein
MHSSEMPKYWASHSIKLWMLKDFVDGSQLEWDMDAHKSW